MSASETKDTTAAKGNSPRKKALTVISLAVLLGLGAYGVYQWVVGSRVEQTDNAYVNANVVQITPLVGGTVRAIHVDNTDFVKAGQPLVSLDPADARVALEQAESQLAQTVREVRTLYANNATLASQIRSREADVQRAQNELARLNADVQRRAPLLASGAVGREEFDHANAQVSTAKAAVTAAQSALQAAQEQLSSNQVLTDGTSVAEHPNVQRAAARVREAFLAQQRTELPAPVDGWVARRSVQLGQRVAAGAPLMAVVGLQQAWVDANFKEGQVAKLRIGQKAKLVADVYGNKVEFQGQIVGLSAGTGAAFALLPAQNATGNWIKVVQRVPVRIALDAKQVAEHPLRVGLSMNVTVDVQDQSGKSLVEAQRKEPAAQTAVYDQANAAADADVARIIRANLGSPAKTVNKAMSKAASKPATQPRA
ncbi:EmrA/EmrK family multidrug efflux transporter periplasmic adaptor subunit [Paucibacter sp. KBW04]|uniref:efflux RND transporter periplasmic adaptor subunit n=1 Tax=Paucibacter sp. KBW04 TaxID=2153361 RepID=UPI000F56A0A1|nr:efflux RND transporter periplasmic adaptor subunit [Paucibacter sp. KBW04]RQO58629.1 EmrA/EmrK family multidrug efflux transporter periplasmic adaptor subunit [Paucibacter sp. KBW04]